MPIHRQTRTIRGEDHDLVVLKIQTRDSNGRPLDCQLIYQDQRVSMVGRPEFLTAYIPSKAVAKTGN